MTRGLEFVRLSLPGLVLGVTVLATRVVMRAVTTAKDALIALFSILRFTLKEILFVATYPLFASILPLEKTVSLVSRSILLNFHNSLHIFTPSPSRCYLVNKAQYIFKYTVFVRKI